MVKANFLNAEVTKKILEIWSPLTASQRDLLLGHLNVDIFKKNETIYCEGEMPTHLLCLLSGKVKIYKEGVGGRSQIIRMIKAVDYFGYRAALAKEEYVTSATAVETAEICSIPMWLIVQLIQENSELAMFFIQRLATHLGVADERTVNLTQKHIRGRLAESILFLRDSYGLEEDGSTLSIYLSREDLANLSNMTTSNAIRTLGNFANERIITIDGRKIKIIDEEMLTKISKTG